MLPDMAMTLKKLLSTRRILEMHLQQMVIKRNLLHFVNLKEVRPSQVRSHIGLRKVDLLKKSFRARDIHRVSKLRKTWTRPTTIFLPSAV